MTDDIDLGMCCVDGCYETRFTTMNDENFCVDHWLDPEKGEGDESECRNCGATDDPEHGIIVGASICTVCLTKQFQNETVLSQRESQVAAHKEVTGASNATIADRLDLETSTVDEYVRRGKLKVDQSLATVELLDWY